MSEDPSSPSARAFALSAGDSSIACLRYGDPDSAIVLVNLHQDERTSIEVGVAHVKAGPGRFYRFDAGGERTIEAEVSGRRVRFDPNRIFSSRGVVATLEKFNVDATPAAVGAVGDFAAAFIGLLAVSSAELVVALHNTDDDYSIHSYEAGGDEAHNAERLHIEPDQHRHDFFFVTDARLFEGLKECGRNVVLQATETLEDDGSLSVLCAQQAVRYVNIEACKGAFDVQQAMLRDLFRVVSRDARTKKPDA